MKHLDDSSRRASNDELFASYRRAQRPVNGYWVVAGQVFFSEKAAADAARELRDRTTRQ